MAARPPGGTALVSVIMANHNGGRFLQPAIDAVLAQSGIDLELLLIDDASTDDSPSTIRDAAHRDPRIRAIFARQNAGPAAARNLGLANAQGNWIAIVDSDDLLHPARLSRLVAAAEADGADIAADNLLQFDESGRAAPRAMFAATRPVWLDTADYIASNALFGHGPAYGYLKPVFRAHITSARGLRYNPALRVAEDYDLVLRMLLAGARFRLYPHITYFYRKHPGSISHRLAAAPLRAMLLADNECSAAHPALPPAITDRMALRRASIRRALAFTDIVDALKSRSWAHALALAWRHPRAALLLARPIAARLPRPRLRTTAIQDGRQLCLISRQRIVGATNGSSAYVLDLCRTIAAQGWRVHLLCPSPAVFGRWPVLWLHAEMAVFASIRFRGSWRIGRLVIARNPRIALAAIATLAARLAARLGLRAPRPDAPAPYAVAAPWARQDFLHIARHARACADVLVADYAFLTEGLPYALRPDAPTAVVMHDLFSSRTAQAVRAGLTDSVATISAAAEFRLLGQADTVFAIQPEEAAAVARHLPRTHVLTVPMSVCTVEHAQPGESADILFVGGAAAPNVSGLAWFLDAVWPRVRAHCPHATCTVAGDVGRAIGRDAPGLRRLGRVADLAPLYRRAAIVVSPLLMGSGLKIKLVEAMAHGKAIVASPASLQGLPADIHEAVIEAADADAFAEAILLLLRARGERTARGLAALRLADAWFSPLVAHGGVIRFLQAAGQGWREAGQGWGSSASPPKPPGVGLDQESVATYA